MAKKLNKPAQQGISPISGTAPPAEYQFKPGESGNPTGKRSAGHTIQEWINTLGQQDLPEDELRRVARDKRLGWTKRLAAERILRSMETGDLSDFVPLMKGEKDLAELARELALGREQHRLHDLLRDRARALAPSAREVEVRGAH